MAREIWEVNEQLLMPFRPVEDCANRMFGFVVVRVGERVFRLTPSNPEVFVFRVSRAARAAGERALTQPAPDRGPKRDG